MNHSTIIEKFYKGELEPNQTFVREIDKTPNEQVSYFELRVSEDGDTLKSSAYSQNRTYLYESHVYKKNDTKRGYEFYEVSSDWQNSGYDNALDKKTI